MGALKPASHKRLPPRPSPVKVLRCSKSNALAATAVQEPLTHDGDRSAWKDTAFGVATSALQSRFVATSSLAGATTGEPSPRAGLQGGPPRLPGIYRHIDRKRSCRKVAVARKACVGWMNNSMFLQYHAMTSLGRQTSCGSFYWRFEVGLEAADALHVLFAGFSFGGFMHRARGPPARARAGGLSTNLAKAKQVTQDSCRRLRHFSAPDTRQSSWGRQQSEWTQGQCSRRHALFSRASRRR